jgi:hypothetical protein
MPDGSVLVVEIERGTLSLVLADGTVEVAAECGGGPNGAAVGPDGKVYIKPDQVDEATTPLSWRAPISTLDRPSTSARISSVC